MRKLKCSIELFSHKSITNNVSKLLNWQTCISLLYIMSAFTIYLHSELQFIPSSILIMYIYIAKQWSIFTKSSHNVAPVCSIDANCGKISVKFYNYFPRKMFNVTHWISFVRNIKATNSVRLPWKKIQNQIWMDIIDQLFRPPPPKKNIYVKVFSFRQPF